MRPPCSAEYAAGIVDKAVQTIEAASGKSFKDYMRIVREHYPPKPLDERHVLKAIIDSLATAGMKGSVLTKNPDRARTVFCGYDPEQLKKVKLESLWEAGVGFSKSKLQGCLDAAVFVTQVQTQYGSFDAYVAYYCPHGATLDERWEFLKLLAEPITNFRLVLASNFLKEMGLESFAKPDRQLQRTLTRIFKGEDKRLYPVDDTFFLADYLAEVTGRTLAEIDKIFWTLGSGRWPDENGDYHDGKPVCVKGAPEQQLPRCAVCDLSNVCAYFQHRTNKLEKNPPLA